MLSTKNIDAWATDEADVSPVFVATTEDDVAVVRYSCAEALIHEMAHAVVIGWSIRPGRLRGLTDHVSDRYSAHRRPALPDSTADREECLALAVESLVLAECRGLAGAWPEVLSYAVRENVRLLSIREARKLVWEYRQRPRAGRLAGKVLAVLRELERITL